MLTIVVLTMLLLVGLLAGYRYLLRPWFVAGYFIVGSLVLIVNAGRLDLQVFTWVKVFTLAVSVGVIVGCARAAGRLQSGFKWAATLILALNILEAVLADAFGRQWVNALVGVSLMATAGRPSRVTVTSVVGRPAMAYDLPWSWILTYTVWNLSVVCAHYPLHWLDHLAVLSAPIIAALGLRDRRLWLEARAFTLAVYAVGIVLAIDLGGFAWIPPGPSPVAIYPGLVTLGVALAVWNGWGWFGGRRTALTAKAAL